MNAIPADEGEVPGPPASGKTGNHYLVRRGLDIPQLNKGHMRHSSVILEGSGSSVLKAASVSKEKKEEACLFNGSRKVQLGA